VECHRKTLFFLNVTEKLLALPSGLEFSDVIAAEAGKIDLRYVVVSETLTTSAEFVAGIAAVQRGRLAIEHIFRREAARQSGQVTAGAA
jgi:hypothetical protein